MKKRSEGFFGLHFDFHSGAAETEIGKNTTEEMVREIIETLSPDYIQCDCKGHPGYSSYPTKVGNPSPGIVKDGLKVWRKVTRDYGISLTMHYSGVWDARALALHPEWAVTNEDGTRHKDMTSTFKGYVDGLMIPQLIELANDYGVDAVWVDGECWATLPDFDKPILAEFEKESGLKLIKDTEGKYDKRSKEYRAFLNFCRKQYFNYLSHYIDEVHARTKNFEIASNWAFTSFMPQPVCVNVDYLSGDFAPTDSYNSARFEARVLCEQPLPWDLMAWGFYYSFSSASVFAIKSADALCREAATVISLGGGCLIYNSQNRDGSVRLWEIHELKPVAKFMRDREPILKGCEPFSNIGILYSDHDMANRVDTLFYTGGNEAPKGAVRMVLDAAHTCSFLMDSMINPEGLKDKSIVILPEIMYIRDEMKAALLAFVKGGGNLMITGHEGCKAFEDVLDAKISDECGDQKISIFNGSRRTNQYARIANTISTGATCDIVKQHSTGGTGTVENPKQLVTVTKTKHGQGTIMAVYYNIFENYFRDPDFYIRNMMAELLDGLGAEKVVEYEGQKFVDIVTSRKEGKLLINLINTSGIYNEARVRAYDEIQPLADLTIRVKTDKPPKSVTLQPENIVPNYRHDAATQTVTVTIDRLHIHAVVVMDF